MVSEILMHIDEDLNESQMQELLAAMGNSEHGLRPHLHAEQPHMLFVAYDRDRMMPHDLVDIAAQRGVHAQLIEL